MKRVQFSGRLPLQHAMEARVQICILAQEMGNLMSKEHFLTGHVPGKRRLNYQQLTVSEYVAYVLGKTSLYSRNCRLTSCEQA